MVGTTGTKIAEILLVEDNPGDVLLIREAFSELGFEGRFHVVEDGIQAISFLRQQDGYEAAIRPDLIILDLNLPRKDGREVLAEIKADPLLRSIPVVILTTSDAEDEVEKVYGLHANCFITKPSFFENFINVVKSIQTFWFSIVKLP